MLDSLGNITLKLFFFLKVRRGGHEEVEQEVFAPLKLSKAVLEQTKDFKENIPLIHILCNPGLRQRHWDKVNIPCPILLFGSVHVSVYSLL